MTAPLIPSPATVAGELSGDARILRLNRALKTTIATFNAKPPKDDAVADACCDRWHQLRMAIAKTPATGAAGIAVKLDLLRRDIEDAADSPWRRPLIAAIRRDVRRLLPGGQR